MKWSAALLALAALSAHAQSGDLASLRKEVYDAETALLRTRYHYRDCADPSVQAELAALRGLEVKRVAESEAVLLANGQPSMNRLTHLQISGDGDFLDVHSLLRRIASIGDGRAIDFETLQLKARDGGDVTFDARLAIGCWDSTAKALDVTFAPRGTVVETETAMFREKLTKLRAVLATAEQLNERMQPRRLREALATVADGFREQAVLVSDLTFRDPELTLHGVALGAAARDAVARSLRGPRFETTKLDWSSAGDCRAFTATTRVTGKRPDADDLIPGEIFDERTKSLCAAPPSASPTAITAHGSGNLTLHLRGADVTNVFEILHELSPTDGFIVEGDVRRPVDVDLDNVTAAEAIAALRAAGVAFITDGPLHRVCKTACAEIADQKYEGELISFSLTGADATDVLGALHMATGLEMHVPRDLKGTVSMYVLDTPWDLALASLVATLRLPYSIDGLTVYFGPDRANTVPVDKFPTRIVSRRELSVRSLDKLGADDIRLAGIAGANGTWKAYARIPGSRTGRLLPLTAGAALFDARVESIGADKVTLKTKPGRKVEVAIGR